MRKMLFAAVSLVALVAGGIPAAFADPPKITIPEDFILSDPCTGEQVHFTGSTTFSFAFSTNNNTFHISDHATERLDGVGLTTGAKYRTNVEENLEANGSLSGFPVEENMVFNQHVIAQGALDNFNLKETFHITINANGTITVDRISVEASCQS
jgi:hypothetical protein